VSWIFFWNELQTRNIKIKGNVDKGWTFDAL